MPHIQVACAIIEHNGKVMAAQRSAVMSLPLKWEFPGGKIRVGETPDHCLHRELMEELGVQVHIVRTMRPITHHYSNFSVTLHPFVCILAGGEVRNIEHAALVWLPPEQLPTLDWLEADWSIIADYRRLHDGACNRDRALVPK